jgi:hypothetical protein
LRAGAGLPHHQWKLVVEMTGDHLIGGFDNRRGAGCVEQSQIVINLGSRTLDLGQRMNQRRRHMLIGNFEILQRALRLRAP